MGQSHDNFVKYPRTPHLFGSRGTDDDKHMGRRESQDFITDASLIVEEKLDGTNVGIHFTVDRELVLQCRGHQITAGMHAQYDLFKQWTMYKKTVLWDMLEDQFILFGEWVYAKHSIHYRNLPHYFFEFDIFDKSEGVFLDYQSRMAILANTGIVTVPVIHRGPIAQEQIDSIIGPSAFDSVFDNPETGQPDSLMEGIYLRTEGEGRVTGRAKIVRPEFVEKIRQSEHWQQQAIVPNRLADPEGVWQ